MLDSPFISFHLGRGLSHVAQGGVRGTAPHAGSAGGRMDHGSSGFGVRGGEDAGGV